MGGGGRTPIGGRGAIMTGGGTTPNSCLGGFGATAGGRVWSGRGTTAGFDGGGGDGRIGGGMVAPPGGAGAGAFLGGGAP